MNPRDVDMFFSFYFRDKGTGVKEKNSMCGYFGLGCILSFIVYKFEQRFDLEEDEILISIINFVSNYFHEKNHEDPEENTDIRIQQLTNFCDKREIFIKKLIKMLEDYNENNDEIHDRRKKLMNKEKSTLRKQLYSL